MLLSLSFTLGLGHPLLPMVIRVEVCNNQLKPSSTSAQNPLMPSHASWRNSLIPHLAFQVTSLPDTLMPHFSDLGSQVIPSHRELLQSTAPCSPALTCSSSNIPNKLPIGSLPLMFPFPGAQFPQPSSLSCSSVQVSLISETHSLSSSATTPPSDYQFILHI